MTKPLADLWREHPRVHRATVLGNGRGLDRYQPSPADGFVIGVNMAPLVFPVHLATTNDQGIDWHDNTVRFEPYVDLDCLRVRRKSNYLGEGADYVFVEGEDVPAPLSRTSSGVGIHIARMLGVRELRLIGFNAYHDPKDCEYARCLEGTRFKSHTQWRRSKGSRIYNAVNKALRDLLEECQFPYIHWLDTNILRTHDEAAG